MPTEHVPTKELSLKKVKTEREVREPVINNKTYML